LYNQAEEEFNVSLRRVDSALPETALKAS